MGFRWEDASICQRQSFLALPQNTSGQFGRRECKSVNLDKQLKQRTERSENVSLIKSKMLKRSALPLLVEYTEKCAFKQHGSKHGSSYLEILPPLQVLLTSEASASRVLSRSHQGRPSSLTQFPHKLIKPVNPTKVSQVIRLQGLQATSTYLYMLNPTTYPLLRHGTAQDNGPSHLQKPTPPAAATALAQRSSHGLPTPCLAAPRRLRDDMNRCLLEAQSAV